MTKCPGCNEINPESIKFCASCGYNLLSKSSRVERRLVWAVVAGFLTASVLAGMILLVLLINQPDIATHPTAVILGTLSSLDSTVSSTAVGGRSTAPVITLTTAPLFQDILSGLRLQELVASNALPTLISITPTPVPVAPTATLPPSPFPYNLKVLAKRTTNGATIAMAWKGDYLATGGTDRIVRVWNEAGELSYSYQEHTGTITSLSWSPDGLKLVSGGEDGNVFIWSLENPPKPRYLVSANNGRFTNVAWSPDGGRLAFSGVNGEIKLFDLVTNQVTLRLIGHSDAVRSLAWSPDSRHLASISFDKKIKIWDTQTGRLLLDLAGHTRLGLTVAWSPDGQRLVSGGADNTIRLWDSNTGQMLAVNSGDHSYWVRSVAWSPDGKIIASASFDGTVRFWLASILVNIATPYSLTNRFVCLTFHPDGRLAISGDNGRLEEPGNLSDLILANLNKN